ncbi:hypothetical protein LTR37_009240 [Vermiconidia calcicola]|uniref:Uncharacterized protein n=1 Tax=Vermiconidia calcicola TaxID=1690605 RepID=A0ACC3N8I3_9PEZI|nr:hypothetical protein LTR37_009240 [Vermiconidia calcicola]
MSATNAAAKTAAKAPAKPTAAPGASSAQPSAAGSVAGDNKAIEKLETTTKAVNANNIARVANSQLTANGEALHPLVSLKTGKPIEKFPKTSKDIDKVTLTMIDGMLNELQADRSGSEAIKRERFRVQIGLKANPA